MTSSSHPFPHATLTTIDSPPNAASIKQLTREVYANLRSVYSANGGGANGHLGLAMPTAQYVIRAGLPYVDPQHPGPLPVHAAGSTGPVITAINRAYDHSLAEFQTHHSVNESVRAQILQAVPNIYTQALEDPDFGYSDVTIISILSHLRTTYGQLTPKDLEDNRELLKDRWNPDAPLEDLWKHIRTIRATAIAGAVPIADGTTIELTLVALTKAGVYNHAITTWQDRDTMDHTWLNFVAHFTKHEKIRRSKLTAQAAGYHGAHNTMPPPPPLHNPTPQLAAAALPIPTYRSNGIDLYYCHTHGLSRNKDHTSHSCSNKGPDHVDDATIDNRKGGIQKINFGRSGKPRRSAASSPDA